LGTLDSEDSIPILTSLLASFEMMANSLVVLLSTTCNPSTSFEKTSGIVKMASPYPSPLTNLSSRVKEGSIASCNSIVSLLLYF
jgi:hypothetical protein